ncbi:MAG TPA: glycosyltransferase, partial [Phycisphaerae bacterium]|nr:glycosyltransferase [Phycisphaerae bacterium]
LSQLNLQDLIATSGDDYIAKAIALASDLPRLSHLRATLRKTLLDSPLTNAQRFAANLQSLFQSCSESRL